MLRVPLYIYYSSRVSILRELDASGGTYYFSVMVENLGVFISVVTVIILGSFYSLSSCLCTFYQNTCWSYSALLMSLFASCLCIGFFSSLRQKEVNERNQLSTLSTLGWGGSDMLSSHCPISSSAEPRFRRFRSLHLFPASNPHGCIKMTSIMVSNLSSLI